MENFTNRLKVAIAALLMGLSAVVNAEDLEIVIGKIASGTTQSYDAGCMASGAKRRVYFRSNGPDNTSISGYDGGSKMGNTSNIGSKLESGSKYYLKMTVETGEKITIYFYHTSTFTNKHINVSDSTNTTAYVEQIVVNNSNAKVLQSVEWTATFTGVAYFSTDNTMCFPAVVVPSNCYTGPKAPVLSISNNATQSVSQGNAISNIVVTSDKAATFNLAGSLPTGVSGTATDSKTYTISGSSNAIGNYTYSVTATADDLTSDAVGGTISVVEGPALNITNATQEVMVGNAITNIVVTSDNPSTTFGVTGLPAGVTGSGSGSTYTISGTPTAEGTFNFVVSGTAGGNTKTVNGTITVVERQETSMNYTILTTKSATPTIANGGIPAALEGTVVSSIKSTWDGTNGYKIGANADTLIVDISALPQGTYIKSASFTVKMGSTYTIGYIYDKEDKQTYNFGSSGAVATATPANEYGRVLKIFRSYATSTTIGDITLTIATGVVMPPVLTASNNVNQTISAGKAIQDIVITSDKPATFDGTLPAGLTGTTSNGGLTYTISGTPSSSTDVAFSVTATAEGKTSQAVSGTISIIQGPVLNITNASQTTTNGTAIKTIQITSNDGETTYSVSGLPSGVTGSGSGTSFAISGTPTAVGTFQYVVTGTLGGYSKTVNGTIIVQPAAPKLTASSNVEQEVQLNHAISTITITSDTAVAFSISCLPAGVVAIAGADSTRLIITGKATMLETTSFSVVAKAHGKGKQSNSISGQITVTEDAVAAAPVLTPSASSISVDKGVAITDLVITSDVAATWAIDKALPAGLTGTASADGLTYTISGTPTAVSASSVYTISATANELTTEQPVTIAVNAVAPVVTAPSNATQNVALGEAIGNISFSSSDADAVFSVEGLPAGLTAVKNGSTYTISGTATAAGKFTYTVTATVDGKSATKSGVITIAATAPTVTLSADKTSVITGSKVTLTATPVVKNSGATVEKVVITEGATIIATLTGAPYQAEYIVATAGSHVLTATVTDSYGYTGTNTVTVAGVDATAPAVVLSADKTAIGVGESVSLSANTTLTNGTSVTSTVIKNGTETSVSATGASATYTFTPTTAGTYKFTAEGTDNNGQIGVSDVVTIVVTSVDPEVSLSSDETSVLAGTKVTLKATASANNVNSTVKNVVITEGETVIATLTAAPYETEFTVTEGDHILKATVTDSYGYTAASTITVTGIAAQLPTVVLSSNATSVFAGTGVTLTATPAAITEGATITKVEIAEGENVIAILTSAPYTYEYTVTAGNHVLTATVTDSYYMTGTDDITIVGNNPEGPTVSLVATKESIELGESVTLTATTSLGNGGSSVKKTIIKDANGVIASENSSVATFNFTPTTAGTYKFLAEGVDNNDLVGTSSEIIITVAEPTAPTATIGVDNDEVEVGETVTITVDAQATAAGATIEKVEIISGASVIATLTQAPYEYEFTATTAGDYKFAAKVIDSNSSSFVTGEVTITVNETLPTSVSESAASPVWKQIEDLVTIENIEVKEMWLFSASGALISKVDGNSIDVSMMPNGERFIVAAKVAGRANLISNKFIK